jgi:hypothetical protein
LLLPKTNTELQAFEEFGYLSPHCTAHLLALVVKDVIESQAHVTKAIDVIRRSVRLFRRSDGLRVQLESAQKDANVIQPLVLIIVSVFVFPEKLNSKYRTA